VGAPCATSLQNAAAALAPDQRFNLIFTSPDGCSAVARHMLAPTEENLAKARQLLDRGGGGIGGATDALPRPQAGPGLKPAVIFLMTVPADYPKKPSPRPDPQAQPDKKTRINTIALIDPRPDLRRLPQANLKRKRRRLSNSPPTATSTPRNLRNGTHSGGRHGESRGPGSKRFVTRPGSGSPTIVRIHADARRAAAFSTRRPRHIAMRAQRENRPRTPRARVDAHRLWGSPSRGG